MVFTTAPSYRNVSVCAACIVVCLCFLWGEIIVNCHAVKYLNMILLFRICRSVSSDLSGHRSSDVAQKLTFHVTRKSRCTDGQISEGRFGGICRCKCPELDIEGQFG